MSAPSGRVVVAIDGPAASGKSTVAAALAARLGVPHVDTGAFYRAATLLVLRAGVDPGDAEACTALLAGVTISRTRGRTRIDGEDVEEAIRGPAVTELVSAVSGHPALRTALRALQRDAVGQEGGVVEGRDAGTVVVPEAALKVWLTATPEARAVRRATQLGQTDPEIVAAHTADIAQRDAADAARMVRAAEAVELDTTGRDVATIVEELVALLELAPGSSAPSTPSPPTPSEEQS